MGKGNDKFMKNFCLILVYFFLYFWIDIGFFNVKVNKIGFYWIIGNRFINVVRLFDKYMCVEIEFY